MKFLIILLSVLFSITTFAGETNLKIKAKWLLAHEPIDLFKIAADTFTKEVSEKTKGQFEIEILTISEYEKKYNKGKRLMWNELIPLIQNSQVEMSQTYTTDLGQLSHSMYALDLPYLFRDHAHAQKVLEGQTGEKLLNGLEASNLKGLAFTYSGGYRILPGQKKISRLEDFKGTKVRTSLSPVAMEMFKILGAKPVPLDLSEIEEGFKKHQINEAESTYARYFPLGQDKQAKILNETNHSLLLTSIIMNKKFFDALPEDYKKIVKDAAIVSARAEREYSIAKALETKKEAIFKGITVVTMSDIEMARVKTALNPLYTQFGPMVGSDLVKAIQDQK